MTVAEDRRAHLRHLLRVRLADQGRVSPNQERLWFLHETDPDSDAYHEIVAIRLTGHLDVVALARAVDELVASHAWLRSGIDLVGGHPHRVTRPAPPTALRVDDVEADRLDAWIAEVTQAPFRAAELLNRWRLARLGPDDHALVVVIHHVACDGQSIEILIDELGDHYDAISSGRPIDAIHEPDVDDVAQQLAALVDRIAPERLDEAASALGTADPGVRLPTSGDGSPRTAVVEASMAPADAQRVYAAGRTLGVTAFSLGVAAIGSITAHFAGVDDVAVGVPVDLRVRVGSHDRAVGFFTETALIGVTRAAADALGPLAAGVQDALARAIDRPVPPDAVLAELRTSGAIAPSETPIQTYVGWMEDDEAATLGVTGPAVKHLDGPASEPKSDLNWTVVGDRRARLRVRLEYDAGRIASDVAQRMVDHVLRLLDWGAQHPEESQAAHERNAPEEVALLERWGGEVGDLADESLDLLLDRLTTLDTPILTVAGASSSTTLTGRELMARADDVARHLTRLGVRSGDHVGVSGHRSVGMMASVLGTLRAGAAYVPLDTSLPLARRRTLLDDVHAAVVVGPAHAVDDLGTTYTRVHVDAEGRPSDPTPTAEAGARRDTVRADGPEGRSPEGRAYVIFTSGSTGTPKGVVVSDRAIVARCRSYLDVLGDGATRYLLHSALGFDASSFMYWILMGGGHLVVPDEASAADPARLAAVIRDHGVETTFMVPSLYRHVLAAAGPFGLPSLRQVAIGGEPFPTSIIDTHLTVAPDAELLNVYGPTEVVVTSTAHRVNDRRDPMPIGTPHPGTVARVLDRDGRPTRPGAPGELELSGPCVADGYHDRPTETKEAFRTTASRAYLTGDIVRWNGRGELVFVGRRDRQVKLRGQRIELAGIEATISRIHGVDEVATVVLGSGDAEQLVAVVSPALDRTAIAQLRSQLGSLLPRGWVPDRIIAVPEIPRTSSWKLDMRGVNETVQAHEIEDAGPMEQPRGYTERAIAANISALLGVDSVDPRDDFFELGGHSLLAARLAGMIAAQFGVAIPLAELIRDASARRLAQIVDDGLVPAWQLERTDVEVSPVRAEGSSAPLAIVARDGETAMILRHFLLHMDVDRPIWLVALPTPPVDRSVPDLVEHGRRAADALLAEFPDGPIHLLGHSASGIIALEAGRALGERAGRVVLLDTVAPITPVDWLRRPSWVLGELLDRPRLLVRAVRDRLRLRRAETLRTAPEALAVRRLRDRQYILASRRYRARRFSGDVVLVTCDESIEILSDQHLGWDRWLTDIEQVALPGDHHGVLLPPSVEHTVEAIDAALRPAP